MIENCGGVRLLKRAACPSDMGSWVRRGDFPGPKRWATALNISVLNKMPRDCTAPNALRMYSPFGQRIQYRPHCRSAILLTVYTMNRNERSIKIGQKVLEKAVSEDGRDWIVAALDPFHDFQRQLAGYPDTDCVNTVVSEFQYEMDVSKPPGAAGNWDCHVFTTPLGIPSTFVQSTSLLNMANFTISDFTIRGMSILNAWTADAGQPLFPKNNAIFTPTNFVENNINAANALGSGSSRVIAMGFEVVNTTADLTKQGALTAYRMPQPDRPADTLLVTEIVAAPANKVQQQFRQYRSLPSTPAEAVLMKGTRQWAAADGAYVVVPLSDIHNPFTSPSHEACMFETSMPVNTGELALTQAMYATGAPALDASNLNSAYGAQNKFIPYNSCGLFLTGLSPTTTLRIKMKLVVERAPTFADTALAPLASPSAAYDATVLSIYSAALASLPVAVPVAMNGFGDWFREVLSVVGNVASPVGAMFGPAGAMIGNAVSTVAKSASNALAKDEYKPETKQAMFKMQAEKNPAKNPGKKKPRAIVLPKSMRRLKIGPK